MGRYGGEYGYRRRTKNPFGFDPSLDHSLKTPDFKRLASLVSRASYPNWAFPLFLEGDLFFVEAFRPDPASPKLLQQLGPWPIAADAGIEEVEAAILAAVISVDGESAKERFRFRR